MDRFVGSEAIFATAEAEHRAAVDLEDDNGITPLVEACYELRPSAVNRLLRLGAHPSASARFAGGVTPAVAVILAVADAFDTGKREIKLIADARHAVQIWALLVAAGGGLCAFPPGILIRRSVLRILQEAAAQENETFILVSLVRAEERMYKDCR